VHPYLQLHVKQSSLGFTTYLQLHVKQSSLEYTTYLQLHVKQSSLGYTTYLQLHVKQSSLYKAPSLFEICKRCTVEPVLRGHIWDKEKVAL
jgi:hypothetical protein